MKNELNTIGKRIKYRMLVLDMNAAQLAEKTSRSPAVISNWTLDRNEPSTSVLPSLARVLACSLAWLLTGEEEHAPPRHP